jgi:hypothetical protein
MKTKVAKSIGLLVVSFFMLALFASTASAMMLFRCNSNGFADVSMDGGGHWAGTGQACPGGIVFRLEFGDSPTKVSETGRKFLSLLESNAQRVSLKPLNKKEAYEAQKTFIESKNIEIIYLSKKDISMKLRVYFSAIDPKWEERTESQLAVPGLQAPPGPTTSRAAGFTLTVPPNNAVLPAQSNVAIQWTGGNPTWKVYLSLVDIAAWTAVTTVANNIPNSGSFNWTFPSSLGCNKNYLFYIAEVNNQTWHYGPAFTLQCAPPAYDIKLLKVKTGTSYKITLVNVGSPIVGPAKITVQDTLPGGLTVMGGQGSAPTWTMTPSAPIVGPQQITLTYNILTATTIPQGGTIGWFNLGAVVDIKQNCAKVTILSVNNTVVTETNVANNTVCVQ